ncbi:MAG: head-tail adaptor protein [Clostridia bacterium]|nr:head-tail adaptor protein [Clostridia bacterium]
MSDYRVEIKNPIPLVLLIPKSISKVKGVNRYVYPTIEEALAIKDENNNSINLFFGSFKTYGGTEKTVNGIYSIEDTANIETWYRPDIASNCKISRASDNAIFDIINEPEDINQRHQFLKFKVRRVKGGV